MKCLNCNKKLVATQKKFCCNKCQKEFQYKEKIQEWKNGEFDGMSGQYGLSKYVKKYMLEKAEYKCEECGWNKINPYTQLIPLEIHHKDGNHRNNSEENLQVLCPCCHSLTDTYKSLNSTGREYRKGVGRKEQKNFCIDCGKEIFITSTRCRDCAAKQQITDKPVIREELKKLIRTLPFTQIGLMFGVTDNTIRKWCDGYNLPRKKTEINKYSDEDWEKI